MLFQDWEHVLFGNADIINLVLDKGIELGSQINILRAVMMACLKVL